MMAMMTKGMKNSVVCAEPSSVVWNAALEKRVCGVLLD
jgi:hypothetical protein